MSPVLRTRVLLVLLAVVIVLLSTMPQATTLVLAQQSPIETPTFAFPTPIFPTPIFPTPVFGTPIAPPGPVFSPTPTPDYRMITEVKEPKAGDAVSGYAPIIGTAVIADFIKYQVDISPAGADNWTFLLSSGKVVRNGILHALNTYILDDGFYDLRVRAIKRDGNYNETFVRNLEVRNANPPTVTPVIDALGTLQPVSPLFAGSLPLPTLTPTPIFQSYVTNGQGIYLPPNGAIVKGATTIVGTVNGKTYLNPFERYELAVAPSGSTEWSWLYSGDQQYWQSPIYTWDTTKLADGFYDLRLRVIYRDGNYDEYYVSRLQVANQTSPAVLQKQGEVSNAGTTPGLYFPLDNAQISGQLELAGTTDVANLLRWEIYWSPAGADDWHFLVSDGRPLVNSTLANLDLRLLPGGAYDFRLRIVRRDYGHTDYDVHNVWVTPPTPTPIPTAPFG
jgi:hypothetical protein